MGKRLLLLGSGLALAALGFSIYTKPVITLDDVVPALNNPSVQSLMANRDNETLKPYSMLFKAPLNLGKQCYKATPQHLAEGMFKSWVFQPEKTLFRVFVPQYEPFSLKVGTMIYGMFKVEVSNDEQVALRWKLGALEGLHVFKVDNVTGTGSFETIYWSHRKKHERFSPLLEWFHILYSRLLLRAAVDSFGN